MDDQSSTAVRALLLPQQADEAATQCCDEAHLWQRLHHSTWYCAMQHASRQGEAAQAHQAAHLMPLLEPLLEPPDLNRVLCCPTVCKDASPTMLQQ